MDQMNLEAWHARATDTAGCVSEQTAQALHATVGTGGQRLGPVILCHRFGIGAHSLILRRTICWAMTGIPEGERFCRRSVCRDVCGQAVLSICMLHCMWATGWRVGHPYVLSLKKRALAAR